MKKTYLKSTLQPGERIFYVGKPHPAFLIPHSIAAVVFFIAIAKVIAAFGFASATPLVWLGLLVPVAYLIPHVITFFTVEAALTSDRILAKTGWISRKVSEINLSKVESTAIDQGIFGRIFGFADLSVKGSGGHAVTAIALADAMNFRAAVQNAVSERSAALSSRSSQPA